MHNSAEHRAMLEVPCPNCGELSPEPAERIAGNDVIPCSFFADLIDLNADDCQSVVAQAKAILARPRSRQSSLSSTRIEQFITPRPYIDVLTKCTVFMLRLVQLQGLAASPKINRAMMKFFGKC
jgi:endogenous inhibitor of DNA gyrase (YacG/DUF329 family)